MTSSPTTGQKLPVCTHCGTVVRDQLFSMDDGAHCCESCFLTRRISPEWSGATNDLYAGFVEALAETLDVREHETGLHSRRVACHTQVLARRFITEVEQLRQIYWGSLLHDIGKIGVPDRILCKRGPLTLAEWRVMQTHPDMGYRIVSRLPGMNLAADIVRCHEERFDGTGYPQGLNGQAIPFGARLFAVIDTLDAMTSERPYRQGLTFDAARDEIARLAGIQFDPVVVAAFLAEERTLRDMVALKCGPEGLQPMAPGSSR